MKYLYSLSQKELKGFFDSFDQIYCDCDGVLMVSTFLFPNIEKPIRKLKQLQKKISFVSNNTSESCSELCKKFISNGINCKMDDFLTPAAAIINHLRNVSFHGEIFLISLPGLKEDLQNAGFKIHENNAILKEYKAKSLKAELETKSKDIRAVIICIDFNMTVLSLNKAINYLRNEQTLFFVTGNDKTLLFPLKENNLCLGPGYFQQIAQKLSGRNPWVYGKPSKHIANFIFSKNKTAPERILFIGDSLEQDISFGKHLGYKQLLVLSGNTKLEDLKSAQECLPDYYLDDFQALDSLIDKAYA